MLVIATPDTFRARKMIEIARTLKPDIDTVVRTNTDEEADLLRSENAGRVFIGRARTRQRDVAPHSRAHGQLEHFSNASADKSQ